MNRFAILERNVMSRNRLALAIVAVPVLAAWLRGLCSGEVG